MSQAGAVVQSTLIVLEPSDPENADAPAGPPAPTPPPRDLKWWLSWAFEFFSAGLATLDVVADALVAAQFHKEGRTGWFWAVVLIMFNSSILFAIVSVETGIKAGNLFGAPGSRMVDWKRKVMYPPMILVGQLLPVVNWVCETWFPKEDLSLMRTHPEPEQGTRIGDVGAGLSVSVESTAEHAQLYQILAWVQRRYCSHGLFIVETAVESIPQSLVQLLAITTAGDRVSAVQVVSLALSVSSIVSKAYTCSIALDMGASLFKFTLISYDVFALFYTFTALADGAGSVGVWYLNGTEVSLLTAVWVWKTAILLALVFLATAVSGCVGLLQLRSECKVDPRHCCAMVGVPIFAAFLYVLVLVPALVAAEGLKLGVLVLLLFVLEPEGRVSGYATCAFTFVRSAEYGSAEQVDRALFVNRFVAESSLACHARVLARKGAVVTAEQAAVMQRLREIRDLCCSTDATIQGLAWALLSQSKTQNCCDGAASWYRSLPRDAKVVVAAWLPAAAAWAIGSALWLLFPFVSIATHREQSALSLFCLSGLGVCLAVALFLTPHMIRYISILEVTTLSYFPPSALTVFHRTDSIDREFARGMQLVYWARWDVVLVWALSERLPVDACDLISQFLAIGDLNTTGLSVAECEKMRAVARVKHAGLRNKRLVVTIPAGTRAP
eukprot:TRINITY_DN729_c4_g1_i3.p1 TRINITY_DN729_c4_g1~~TRINITY_DN729_c4_g1_i3.p1  ORF type:complete len:668 (+),score=164.34 TRINITY_DN729_c4_g1_i3:144-2147(+)